MPAVKQRAVLILRDVLDWSVEEVASLLESSDASVNAAHDFKLVVTSANRMPAVANYVRKHGDAYYRPFTIDALRIESVSVAEVTTFDLPTFLDAFNRLQY